MFMTIERTMFMTVCDSGSHADTQVQRATVLTCQDAPSGQLSLHQPAGLVPTASEPLLATLQ